MQAIGAVCCFDSPRSAAFSLFIRERGASGILDFFLPQFVQPTLQTPEYDREAKIERECFMSKEDMLRPGTVEAGNNI